MRTKLGDEFLFQRLQRILDQVFAVQVLDRGVFLVGVKIEHVLDGNELEAVAAAHADVQCGARLSRAALATCCSCGRVSRAGLAERGAQFLGADGLQQVGDRPRTRKPAWRIRRTR